MKQKQLSELEEEYKIDFEKIVGEKSTLQMTVDRLQP